MTETNGSAQLSETIEEVRKDTLAQTAHDAADLAERRYRDTLWVAHNREHQILDERVQTALRVVEQERLIHVSAHTAEHVAHQREHLLASAFIDERAALMAASHKTEHSLESDARDKAATAINHRLESMNEVRGQLKDQALTFARVEVVQALIDRVIAIEKLDIKGEGKQLGQGAVIAVIVGAMSFVGTILGIVIVISNALTAKGASLP